MFAIAMTLLCTTYVASEVIPNQYYQIIIL